MEQQEDILQKITNRTAQDLIIRKKETSLITLRQMPNYNRKTISFVNAIRNSSGIIAEHKRQSPSKGSFNCPASLHDVVKGYEKAGASALSCLTDEPFFGGTLSDLLEARELTNMPILRKDFMIDLYQVHEAKAHGADAILLIAACLTNEVMQTLSLEALSLELDILYEVHDLDELERVKKITAPYRKERFAIGVNNRDLKRFKTDIQISKDLLPHFPEDVLAISESGISDAQLVKDLRTTGYRGFLIGENFMKTSNPGKSCRDFIDQIRE